VPEVAVVRLVQAQRLALVALAVVDKAHGVTGQTRPLVEMLKQGR
jgi:hypothetical protein